MTTRSDPLVVVIAGPNGAGKSTLAPNILRGPFGVEEFVNADVIARGLSGFHPERAAIAAGRLMLSRLAELANQQVDFAFETTLSTRSFAPLISGWKLSGYRFALVYVWVPASDVSVARVATRVEEGGHDVPAETIRRRYDRSLSNLFELYLPLADFWQVMDNTEGGTTPVIARGNPESEVVFNEEVWSALENSYGIH
jgi:predicted ABC-type ATPase